MSFVFYRGYHESDTTAIWLFKCLDNTDDTKSCAVEKYGGNFDLISIMEFVQTLDVDLVVRLRKS